MTKLHKTATAFLLAAALLLGGCAEQRNSPAQGTENLSSDSNSSDSTEASSSSDPTISERSTSSEDSGSSAISESEPDLQTLIEKFPLENITLPDGSIVSKYEANGGIDEHLKFDFTFIRYAKPVFRNTLDNTDMIDWEKDTDEFKFDPKNDYIIEDTDYFMAKPGDKLENGLVVKTAMCLINEQGDGREFDISYDGELTLSGVLRCAKEKKEYPWTPQGYLEFYADTTIESIPIIFPAYDRDRIYSYVDKEAKFAMVYDDARFVLGNINDVDIDLSSVISPGEYKKVKVTLKNITSHYIEGPDRSLRAELVSVEPMT